ncbi:DUF4097 family beta strand repeat-containing protein [Halobacillus mangrovi]|uniref:DUF4097 family beta strand repeat-containing protein n=1 Tax=Halobacillus mangrovi TaxID=402384 RepID=UPI003D96D684
MNEERMRILKMIEEGTVTAEEGAKLLDAVDDTEKNESDPASNKYGIKHFLGDAVDKIKNADFDLSFGESVTFDYEKSLDPQDFNDLDVSIANGSLEVNTWEEPHVKASYQVKVYQVKSEEEARDRFLTDGQFNIQSGLLRLASPSKKVKTFVKLNIPKKRYEFLKAKLTNGGIKFNQVDSDHFQLKTTNGKIQLSQVSGDKCKIETGNGAITFTEGDFETCEIDTVNGAVNLSGLFGKSDVSALSGNITVEHKGEKAHTAFYKTTAGSVKVNLPMEKRIDGVLRSKVGSLNCQLDNYKILKDKKDVANKLLEFEAYEEYEQAFHIEAETKTGSVTVKAGE